MFNWYLTIGAVVYVIVGQIMMNKVMDYLNELSEKVALYDRRYCQRLFYRVRVTRTKWNEFMVNAVFNVFWPVICIAAILKAEREYDVIVHHSAFRRDVP